MQCDRCTSEHVTKAGRDRQGRQLYRCKGCRRRGCPLGAGRSSSAFRGYRFPDEVIAFAVRWYLRYRLSYADVAEGLAERGVTVAAQGPTSTARAADQLLDLRQSEAVAESRRGAPESRG